MRAQIEMLARQAGLLEPDARVGDFLAAVTNRCASDIFANLGAVIGAGGVDARGPRGITLDRPGSWNLLAKCEQVGYRSPLW